MLCSQDEQSYCELHGYHASVPANVDAAGRLAHARAHTRVIESFEVSPVVGGWHARYGNGAVKGATIEEAVLLAREAVKRNKRLSIQALVSRTEG